MAPRDPNKPSFPPPPADHGPPQTSSSGSAPQALQTSSPSTNTSTADTGVDFRRSLPSVTLPTSGGAIRKIDEKFKVNPASGGCALTVPIPVSNARSVSATPSLSLGYNSGGGNGPFGLGWGINPVPHITRKTDKGIPRYTDEFDTFIFSDSEDLVPRLTEGAQPTISEVDRGGYTVRQYLPRIENGFSRIERLTSTNLSEPGDVFWRVLTADNHCFIFGKDHTSRISDGENQDRIYSWLLCQSYDCYGNVIEYSYKPENRIGIPTLPSEQNRSDETCARNRYLKSIKYGNRVSRYREGWKDGPNPWMFELVLDYGEHALTFPSAAGGEDWTCRKDPFSSYRAGFEIRTYRLCRRILMFHHLPEDLGGVTDCLVFSTNLEYEENPVASLLQKITGIGHLLQARQYSTESMPTLSLGYSKSPALDELVVQDSDAPFNLAGNAYEWVDLNSEGLPGVLCEQAGSWFYRHNLSANNFIDSTSTPVPRFGPLELVDPRPAPSLRSHTTRLADLDASGEVDVVDDSVRGFYERTTADGWTNFRPFSSWPNVDLSQPGVRFVDLTGDGMADIMVTEDEAFSWYRSMGKEGYEAGRRIFQPHDEEKGPRMVWMDPESAERIYLSDFSGDGLLDLVRIRNGGICYWPSLGYGLFGDKVTMDNAPWFDHIDQFTHDRLHLTDIDGSGTMDLLYLLASGGANVYRNQAGNGWSDADPLQSFPQIDSISTVSTVDLLGTGCACLVWTRPSDRTRLQYIDLVGGQKPFLLTWHANDLGLETKVSYTPSTRFYLDAQGSGKPWVTRLPFPVHCVEKTEAFDNVSRSYFSTRYAYHHGFYDRVEREFRGFGMVEQWDTEEYKSMVHFSNASNMEKAYVIPPVHTKMWFHTGAAT